MRRAYRAQIDSLIKLKGLNSFKITQAHSLELKRSHLDFKIAQRATSSQKSASGSKGDSRELEKAQHGMKEGLSKTHSELQAQKAHQRKSMELKIDP